MQQQSRCSPRSLQQPALLNLATVGTESAACETSDNGARDKRCEQQCLGGVCSKDERQHQTCPASHPSAVRETTFFARGSSVGRSMMAEWQLQTALGPECGCFNAAYSGANPPASVLSPWIGV